MQLKAPSNPAPVQKIPHSWAIDNVRQLCLRTYLPGAVGDVVVGADEQDVLRLQVRVRQPALVHERHRAAQLEANVAHLRQRVRLVAVLLLSAE